MSFRDFNPFSVLHGNTEALFRSLPDPFQYFPGFKVRPCQDITFFSEQITDLEFTLVGGNIGGNRIAFSDLVRCHQRLLACRLVGLEAYRVMEPLLELVRRIKLDLVGSLVSIEFSENGCRFVQINVLQESTISRPRSPDKLYQLRLSSSGLHERAEIQRSSTLP